MNRLLAIAAVSIAALNGCSLLSVGDSEFSCPGLPKGIVCKSTKDVYHLTNGNSSEALVSAPGEEGTAHDKSAARAKGDYDYMPPRADQVEMANYAHAGQVRPLIEPMTSVKPVLEPAKVVRLWIGPWRDTKNNLVFPSYMYAQVGDRTWSLDDEEMVKNKVLTPVQVRSYGDEAAGTGAADKKSDATASAMSMVGPAAAAAQ